MSLMSSKNALSVWDSKDSETLKVISMSVTSDGANILVCVCVRDRERERERSKSMYRTRIGWTTVATHVTHTAIRFLTS